MKTASKSKIIKMPEVDLLIETRYQIAKLNKEAEELKNTILDNMKIHEVKTIYGEYNYALKLETTKQREVDPKKFRKLCSQTEFYQIVKVPVKIAEKMLGEFMLNKISKIKKVKTLKKIFI